MRVHTDCSKMSPVEFISWCHEIKGCRSIPLEFCQNETCAFITFLEWKDHYSDDGLFLGKDRAGAETTHNYRRKWTLSVPEESDNIDNEKFDEIKHAKHYNTHPSGVECIDVIEHHNCNVAMAMKYLWRQGLKDGQSSVKDLTKARQYINREINRLEGVKSWEEQK